MQDDVDGWDSIPADATDQLQAHVDPAKWTDALAPVVIAAGLAGMNASPLAAQIPDSTVTGWTADVSSALSDRTGKIVGEISKTTFDLIEQAVDFARVNGDDKPTLADAIGRVFDMSDARATRIAVTESVGAANAGAAEMAALAVDAGYTVTGTWHHYSGSEHPRPEHEACDGETIAWGDTFSCGLRYPHDEMADGGDTINCGCDASWVATAPDGSEFDAAMDTPEGE